MKAATPRALWILLFVGWAASALPVGAVVEPEAEPLAAKKFRHQILTLPPAARPLLHLKTGAATPKYQALANLGITSQGARVDERGGRFETLLPSHALVAARTAGKKSREQWGSEAHNAFIQFLDDYRDELGIDTGELGAGRVTVHGDGTLIQIYLPRVVAGIPVRGSYVHGVINHGKLSLFGTHRWGDVETPLQPAISAAEAADVASAHMAPYVADGSWGKDRLVLVPTAEGEGYGHRLAWQLHPALQGELGSWEILVDAATGELLSADDTNVYAEVKGGVYPVSNDGISPDGVEQSGWPMPFDNVSTSGGTSTTDTGGNVVAVGSMTSSLSGQYVEIADTCGSISLTQSGGIDFGTSGGDDCTTPGFGGAGNTHASRTGFYELNRIEEMARGWLPANSWLQQQLTANVNLNNTCNAFWNGASVNFYRSGGGCFNTGEIAGVLDHEWGHGMDDNDAVPTIADPSGEGIADVYAALRLNDSCIGRHFRSSPCSGFGDPCLTCTGVRDIDYLQRASGQPHDYTWSNANCGSFVHCTGAVYAEAVWSLWKRKLQAPPYDMSDHTAHELVNRLTFLGGGAVGTWFSGGPPYGGCSALGGYLNFLAADDDDGNINNGTPHMTAIFEAFDDQEIACDSPAVVDTGCANTPAAAPVVSTSAGNHAVGLAWGAVPDASEYHVFRAEGVSACDFGKVKIGETAGTSWNDTGLQNGRDYSYVVIPIGGADTCMGPASSCATAQPVGQPDFALGCSPASHAIAQGENSTASCTVVSSYGYTGTVDLVCSGQPAGVGCSFSPPSVVLPADGSAGSTLTISVDLAQAVGSVAFDVAGDDGSTLRTAPISVEVLPEGTQLALYDPGLGAPKCAVAGSSCDSGTLLDGRDGIGPEPNQPNTLDGCADGFLGTYHDDESNDRIVVSTLDGSRLEEGATVRIDATVWAWSTGADDTLDLYTTADATSPSWVYLTSIVPPVGGAQVLSAQYVLPAGELQAVRARFRYQGSPSPCATGFWDDHDDLVFAVGNQAPAVQITAPADGSTVAEGTPVDFAGTAVDPEEGDLSAALTWTSSIDGVIGTGAAFSTSSLSCGGTHTIDASVTDSEGRTGSDAISLTVTGPATVPVAVANHSFETPALDNGDWSPVIPSWDQIAGVSGVFDPRAPQFPDGPPDGQNTAYINGGTIGQTIAGETLVANAWYVLSVDVGNRLDKPFPGYEIQLVVDGVVRSSADETSVRPAAGTFATATTGFTTTPADAGRPLEIRLVADGEQPNFDNLRLTWSTCGESPPVVTITSPADGATVLEGTSVSFAGTATDAEDGDLSPSLVWISSLDGFIGSGTSFSTSGLSPGGHTITAAVSDSSAIPGSESISITVIPSNTPPVVTITSPADGASFSACQTIGFAATAVDAEDGDLAAGLSWTSSLDGPIGSGASFSLASLSVGTHTITASVTDPGGLVGSDVIAIDVRAVVALAVDNFSFETPALADGDWTPNVPSWTLLSGVGGIFDPTTAQFPAGVPDGDNTAYLNGGILSQTIAAETLVAGSTYELRVDVGDRLDKEFQGYQIQLLVNGVVRASASEVSALPANGDFATARASFVTTAGDAGQSLEIRLRSLFPQPNFDNVRVERSACAGNALPVVTITGPADGSSSTRGASVSFAATADDAEDGDLSAGLAWTSSLDGTIGSGASFSTSSLSCGVHAITASVTDSGGLPGSDAITLTVTGAGATPVAVANFSFETPALADGGWTPTIPSWSQIAGTSGIFNPRAAQFPAGVPSGDNSAYINGGTIGQTIAAETLLSNIDYTLEVDVGDRADKPFPGYEIQLLVNGVVRASADETAASPADGAFATAAASFITTPADAGRSLEIRLITPGEQPNFDNVRLTRSTCN